MSAISPRDTWSMESIVTRRSRFVVAVPKLAKHPVVEVVHGRFAVQPPLARGKGRCVV